MNMLLSSLTTLELELIKTECPTEKEINKAKCRAKYFLKHKYYWRAQDSKKRLA